MEHFIPDLTKLFDEKVVRSTDKNILAGLGMIEVQGFAKTREESALNPKALIEEVKDAVSDWSCLLEEVMYQMLEKNKANRSKLSLSTIRVVPGTIKAFMTDAMKTMLRNLYDRGLVSKQTAIEDIAELDFEVQVERRKAENKSGLHDTMYPPEIQNFEQYPDTTTPAKPQDNNVPPDKTPGSPESKNYKQATKIICAGCNEEVIYSDLQEEYQGAAKCEVCNTLIDKAGNIADKFQAPYETIDELPPAVKNNLPIPAQLQFLRVVNEAKKRGLSDSEAFREAWGVIKKNYKKNPDGKWVKK
jgi:cation transport regulator